MTKMKDSRRKTYSRRKEEETEEGSENVDEQEIKRLIGCRRKTYVKEVKKMEEEEEDEWVGGNGR